MTVNKPDSPTLQYLKTLKQSVLTAFSANLCRIRLSKINQTFVLVVKVPHTCSFIHRRKALH